MTQNPIAKTPSPYKLHIHRAMKHVPISWMGLWAVQQIATLADPMYDIMMAVRSRRFDELLPKLPETSIWLNLYRDHEAMTRGIGNAMPGLWGMDGDATQNSIDNSRRISRVERAKPGAISHQILSAITPFEFMKEIEIALIQIQRDYKRHLIELRQIFRDGLPFDDEDDFDAALKREPAVYFYARVVLPSVMLYQASPQILLRQVRSQKSETKQLEAVERLVRLDPLAIHLPDIIAWSNVDDGEARLMRREKLSKWHQGGLSHGKFDRSGFKAVMGALMQSVANRMGSYLNFKTGKWHPSGMTAAQVKSMLDAAAIDRAGHWRGICDLDIEGIQADSWRRQLHRYRRLWDRLVPSITGHNSLLLESGVNGHN